MSLRTCFCFKLLGQVGTNVWLFCSYISFWLTVHCAYCTVCIKEVYMAFNFYLFVLTTSPGKGIRS